MSTRSITFRIDESDYEKLNDIRNSFKFAKMSDILREAIELYIKTSEQNENKVNPTNNLPRTP